MTETTLLNRAVSFVLVSYTFFETRASNAQSLEKRLNDSLLIDVVLVQISIVYFQIDRASLLNRSSQSSQDLFLRYFLNLL